jgi:hypothetical protein
VLEAACCDVDLTPRGQMGSVEGEESMDTCPVPYRGDRWSLAAVVMMGVAAVVVVVVAIVAGAGGTAVAPSPAPSTPHTPSPTAVPARPLLGFGFSAVDDPMSHQVVVFGGVDSYDTTWLWDGKRWSLAHPRLTPPGRFGAASAYDPLTGLVLLYGGRLGPGDAVDDTWSWDGKTWAELDSGTGAPPAGEGSVMAWDGVHRQMVLVNSAGQSAGQTWLWTGDRWTLHQTGALPVGFFVVGMAVDPATSAFLAVGCCAPGISATSTWSWDGGAWHQVSTHADPPAVVGLAVDPTGGSLLLCSDPTAAATGRQVWTWGGTDWIPHAGARVPVIPEAEVTAFDEGYVLLLGSLVEASQGFPQPVHVWSWSGSAWKQRG